MDEKEAGPKSEHPCVEAAEKGELEQHVMHRDDDNVILMGCIHPWAQ